MEKNSITISLIIPAFNEEKFIFDCLKAATENSDGLIDEIILVDNGSDDKTKEIGSCFPGVRIVEEKERGVMKARQRGYKESKGSIVAFIDADTRMPKGWGAQIVSEFSKDKTLACLTGPYIFYDISEYRAALVDLYWYGLAFPIYKITGFMATAGNMALRKEVLDKMNGLDTSIEFYGDDTDTARRASHFGKVKFSLKFVMYSSARRLIQQGMLNTSTKYMLNYLSEAILKRPITKSSKTYR